MAIKVLYIEDNPDNMTLVRRLLGTAPYELLEAKEGEQGIQMAEQEAVDIILLDINMPHMDGYTVVRRLRNSSQPHLTNTPVIALTANAMRGDDLKAFQAGCTHYISKPINIVEFLETIETIAVTLQAE